jgi:hypothetical protein
MFAGNGTPGPLDDNPVNPGATAIESVTWRSTHAFAERLDALGIPYALDDYGAGTHTWPYWARDLRLSMDALLESFAEPAKRPAAVTFRSADDAFSVYGWRIRMQRDAQAFVTLRDATCRGFTLEGTGSAEVRTPRCGAAGRRTLTVQLPATVTF